MSQIDEHLIPACRFAAFNGCVLDLQRLAQEQPLARFHRHALQRLQALLAFDKAWWGHAAMVADLPEERSSQVFGLPTSYVEDWQSIREQDITIGLVQSRPGRAVIVDSQATDTPPGCAGWAASTASANSSV